MNRVEAYNQILDFIVEGKASYQASVSNLKYHKIFPDLRDFEIQDLLDEMGRLAHPKYLTAKTANGDKVVLFKNERTAQLKNLGGFQLLVDEKGSEQEKKAASIRMLSLSGYFAQLHPTVIRVAAPHLVAGHYKTALQETCTVLSEVVEEKSGLKVDNTKLMEQAFASENPILRLSTNKGEQMGIQYLFKGAMMGIRNKLAHQSNDPYNQQTVLEWLSFLSGLFRLVDEATITNNP